MMKRRGILAAGNFIVDRVKIIDGYPEEGNLSSIIREQQANGGGAYNVLKDLAAMGAPFPLEGVGLVGEDDDGAWILRDCQESGIRTDGLGQTGRAATSYTDVMSVERGGKRTFFHQRGANRFFDMEGFDFGETDARIFHLAYLMLLDRMDEFVVEGRTRASVILERARAEGLVTAVDMVSTRHPMFGEIARSAMAYSDYFIVNEVEAGWILDRNLVDEDIEVIGEAAMELQGGDARRRVIIHFETGAVAADEDGSLWQQAALSLPEGFVRGSVGAGDAFAAGFLHGVHQAWDLPRSLDLGVCAAASSLSHETPSAGVRLVADCLVLGRKYGARR